MDHHPDITPAGWQKLIKLRHAFLKSCGGLANYWQDEQLMAAYEATLAQRIRFKWQAALAVIAQRFTLSSDLATLWDWGCGTGIAARAVVAQFSTQFHAAWLSDRSSAVVNYATQKLRTSAQHINIISPSAAPPGTLFVASHVLSELDETALGLFERDAASAAAILLVESGRPFESRRLCALRERFSAQGFGPLAPCPHRAPCGMLQAERDGDWCHFFAKPPPEVGHSSFWRECAKQLGIDLRSLPLSYILLAKDGFITLRKGLIPQERLMLGRGRRYKGYTAYQACTGQGIIDHNIQKRDDRAMYERAAAPGLDGYY